MKSGISPNHAINHRSKPGALRDKIKPERQVKNIFTMGWIDTGNIILSSNKKMKEKTILGIDPGSTKIGYGAIRYINKESKPKALGYGYIDLKSYNPEGKRLVHLYKDLNEIFNLYKPHSIAVESIYFFKNAKTITPVLQARGIILFTAAKANILTYNYTPLQVKQTISGYGKADKKFIQKIVQTSLDISSNIKPDDASDALAIALCHFRHLTNL